MKSSFLGFTVCILLSATSTTSLAEPAIRNGDTIAFLGDSITQNGYSNPAGYVNLVIDGLKKAQINVVAIPAGVSGNKSNQMLARIDQDVLSKKPQWMTLSCGVNDVWHGEHGVPLEAYKTNIVALVDKADAAGVKVVILTSTMIMEGEPDSANNQKLAAYNTFLRALAKQRGYRIADLSADMIAGHQQGKLYTCDGIHMNILGNKMMASGILRALGVDEPLIQACNESWKSLPKTTKTSIGLSENELSTLKADAAKAQLPLEDYLRSLLFRGK